MSMQVETGRARAADLLPFSARPGASHSSIRKRAGRDGRPRYQADYRDARGRVRTAGTFTTERDAERAWLQRELLPSQGRLGASDTG
jgi:hypothetical protein